MAYDTTAGAPTTSVTVPLTGISVFDDYIRWSDDQSLGSTFAANGLEQFLSLVDLNNANPPGRVRISITGLNNRFTPAFEATGRFTFTASDGETLEVMIANADMTEIYQWTPTNSAEVVAFVLHVKGLTDQDATLTLRGESEVTDVAPTFSGRCRRRPKLDAGHGHCCRHRSHSHGHTDAYLCGSGLAARRDWRLTRLLV